MNLGELIVELCADTSQLEKSLEQAKKSAYDAANSIEKSFGKINLEINVDDDSLTDLNKHLNLKVQHLKEVNKYFNNNPIVVNVDDDSLTDLNKHLNLKVQHLKEVNKYFNSNPIVVNTDVTQLDELEKRLGKLSNKTITITVESELSNQLEKSLTDAVQSAVRDAVSEQSTSSQQQQQKESAPSNRPQRVDVVASPMRSIVDGLFEGVGKKLTKGLDRSIEDAVGVNMDTMTRISGNMLLRYFGVGKKAQSDPKNEQKRVETILKDGMDAFIRNHDGRTRKGGTGRGRTVRSTNDDDIGVDFDSVSRIANNSALRYFGVGKKAQLDPKEQQAKLKAIVEDAIREYSGNDIKQENSGVISRTFSEINAAFSDNISISVESIAQRAKLSTIRQIRKVGSSVTQNSSPNVQNAVSGFFDAAESGKKGSTGSSIGQGLASQSKKAVEVVFDKLLPNTSRIIKDFLSKGVLNKPVTPVVKSSSEILKEAATDLKNAAKNLGDTATDLKNAANTIKSASSNKSSKSFVADAIPDREDTLTQIPVQIPKKESKIPLSPPKAKVKRELEPIPLNIPEQVQPLFRQIQSEIFKNVDLSQEYKDATEAENNLVPLQPAHASKVAKIKQESQVSLSSIEAALKAVNAYFKTEYTKLKQDVTHAISKGGTEQDIKEAKTKLSRFVAKSKDAIATIDNYVQAGEKAGLSKEINSDLSKVHSAGKSTMQSNLNKAKQGIGKLNFAEKKLFDQQLKGYVAQAEGLGINVDEGLKKGIVHGADGVSDAARKMLDDLIKAVKTKMQIQSPSKVMIALGAMIASGLAIGIKQGVVDVSSTLDGLTGMVIGKMKSIQSLPSQDIESFQQTTLNASSQNSELTQKVYDESKGVSKPTAFGSVIGTIMMGLANSGLTPKNIETPLRHLGAFYQGTSQVHKLNSALAREAEIATIFNMMQTAEKEGYLPDGGFVNMVKHENLPTLAHTLGGFNYTQTKDGGLQINDVYDWHNSSETDKNTPFSLPGNLGRKAYSILDKNQWLVNLLGLETNNFGGAKAYSKYDHNTGRELFSFLDKDKHDFQLGHSVHSSVIGGSPYIQTHSLNKEEFDSLIGLAEKPYFKSKSIKGNPNLKSFLEHPEVSKYIKGDQSTDEGGIKKFVSAITKDFGEGSRIKKILDGIFDPLSSQLSKQYDKYYQQFDQQESSGDYKNRVTAQDVFDKLENPNNDMTQESVISLMSAHRRAGMTGDVETQSKLHNILLAQLKANNPNSESIGDKINKIKNLFSKGGNLKDIGINLISSFAQGFLTSSSGVLGIVTNFAKSILSTIKKVFGIASPSKVMESIGLDFGEGFENGAVATLVSANKKIADLMVKAVNQSKTATKDQKDRVERYAADIHTKNERIARGYREGRYTKIEDIEAAGLNVARMSRSQLQASSTKTNAKKLARLSQELDQANKALYPNAEKLQEAKQLLDRYTIEFNKLNKAKEKAESELSLLPSNGITGLLNIGKRKQKQQEIASYTQGIASVQAKLKEASEDYQKKQQIQVQNRENFAKVTSEYYAIYRKIPLIPETSEASKTVQRLTRKHKQHQIPDPWTPIQGTLANLANTVQQTQQKRPQLLLPPARTQATQSYQPIPDPWTPVRETLTNLTNTIRQTQQKRPQLLLPPARTQATQSYPPIRINLAALTSGNLSQLFNRYPQIPDPRTTAPGSGVINFPAPQRPQPNATSRLGQFAVYPARSWSQPTTINQPFNPSFNPFLSVGTSTVPPIPRPVPPVPPFPFIPRPVPPSPPISITPPVPPVPPSPPILPVPPVPPSLINQYLSLGKDLVTNLFTAVGDSVRQSTLSGYASLGQVMRNAVNAALFSLADTLKQPLHQALLSQTRSILPWFMKFIPRALQLTPMLKPLIPAVGALTLGLGNAIVKNLLNNDVLKPGGLLTKLLSSITKIDLASLSGQKAHGVMSAISRLMNPVPGLVGAGGLASGGLGMAGMFMNAFSGILGLDPSTNPNLRGQAPTVEKVLQDQTIANRKKAGLGNARGTQASQELIENLGNTTIDSVLENLNIPMIPTSVVQGLTGKKLKQQSGTIAGVLNSLGVERSKAEQLLEKIVKSGRTDVGRRTDILTKQVLRERGFTQQRRDSMTPSELMAARENILRSPLDLTKRERRLLQFMGDFQTHINNMGNDAAFRKGNAMVMSVLKERGLSYAERQAVKQPQGGLNQVADRLMRNPRTGGFVGRLTEAYAGNDQEAMRGLLLEGLKKAGMSSQQLKNIDPKLLDTATAGLMASLTGLQAKFKEKGFDMGKSIAQGFKDSVRNLANAKDDLEYNAKKVIGKANFGDAIGLIFKRMSRGTAATQDQFKEMYNQMGAGLKRGMFGNPKDADEMFPNMLQFMGSLAATMAPITTLFASLTPLFLPLAPIIGGIGAAVSMVAPHISRLLDGIQRVEILQRRFTFLGGSKAGGEAELKYAKDIATKMNVPSEVAANSYSQLAIAAKDTKMEGQGVKDLFEGITASLSALGISGQDASLVFMAYTQILAKGKLSMEELRQQLGEKFPPAMGVFAKAMGVSVPEMNALISSGSVLSQDILPKVAKVLKEDYGKSASGQAGGLVVALNKLSNVGFEITSIFTDKLGGTLGLFVSTLADGLSFLSGSLHTLIPLGQAFAVGFAATIAIGLSVIKTKVEPLRVLFTSLQSFLMATFSVVTTNMMPMIVGVTADVADSWLGAEKDMIANMMDGVTNLVVAAFSTIDTAMRSMSGGSVSFSSVFGGLVQGAEQAGSMIDWLKGIFEGFFKVIPPGFVELLAMVFMFEQGTALFVMALTPALKGFFGALLGMTSSVSKAFVGFMTSMKVATELMMTSMNASMVAHEARIKIFSATLGFLRKALTHVGVAFAILMFSKGDFSNPMGEALKNSTKELNNGLTEIRANVQKTADSFDKATNNVKKLGGALADTLPSKGVQLDIRSFWGGGDFKWDDAIKARNKGEASPVMDFLGVSALGVGAGGAAFAGIKMLTAALVPIATKATITALTAAQVGSLSMTAASVPFMAKIAMALVPILANPFGAIAVACVAVIAALTAVSAAFDLFAPKLTENQKNLITKNKLKSYFDFTPNVRLTNAQQQIIKYFEDEEQNNLKLKEFADSQGLTGKPTDFVADIKPLTADQQQRFNADTKIASLNKQIEGNNNRRLAVLADAAKDGASPQELKDIANSTNFKNLEKESKEMRNAVALAAATFQIGESPENKKNLKDIDKQIAKKQDQLKKLDDKSKKEAQKDIISSSNFGLIYAPSTSNTKVKEEYNKAKAELQNLEARKETQSKIIKASIQRAFDFREIKNIDKQLEAATKRIVELNKALPSDAVRKEQGAVKQLIQRLYKKREELVDSFGPTLPMLEQMLKQAEEYKKQLTLGAVPGVQGEGLIRAAVIKTQEKINQIKKQIAGVKPFDVRPLEEALYTQATMAIKDAAIKFERATSDNRIKSNLSQAKIYATRRTADIAPEIASLQIEDLGNQRRILTEKMQSNKIALDKLSQAIAANGVNLNEAQAEFDKLREDIAKDKESLSQNALDTIKAQRDMRQALVDQTKQVAEYYRTSVREAQSAGIEFEKATANLEGQQIAAKLRKAVTGAGNNLFTSFVDSLIGIVQQVTDIQNTELDKKKQELDYRNNLEDINLRVLELQRSIPGKIIPFDLGKAVQFNKEIKNIQNSVQEINKEISKVGKSITAEPVNAAMKLNDVLVDVIKNLEKINQRYFNTQANQANSEPWLDVVSDMPVQPQTQPVKPTSSSLEPSKNLTALLGQRPEILIASLDSDVYGIPSFTKQSGKKQTVAPPERHIIPTNSFVSPIGKTTLESLPRLDYAPQDKLGQEGIMLNRQNIKSDHFREVVASLTGVASLLGKTLTITSKVGKKRDHTVEVIYEGLNSSDVMRYLGMRNESEKANVSAGQTLGLLGKGIKFSVALTSPNKERTLVNPLNFFKDLYRVNEKEAPSLPEKVWRKLFDPIIQTVWKLGLRPYRGRPVDNANPKIKFIAQPTGDSILPSVPPNSDINQTPPPYPPLTASKPLRNEPIISNWIKENPLLTLQTKPSASNTPKVVSSPFTPQKPVAPAIKPVAPAIKPVVITVPPVVKSSDIFSQFPQPPQPTNTLTAISTSTSKKPSTSASVQKPKVAPVKKTVPQVPKKVPAVKLAPPASINSIIEAAKQGSPAAGNLQPGITSGGAAATLAADKRKEAAVRNTQATLLRQRTELFRNLESLLLNFQGQLADLPNTIARDELDVEKLVLSIKSPNATPDQRYKTELGSFRLNIAEQKARFQKRIRENEKINITQVTETLKDIKKEFAARGIKYDFSNLDRMAKSINQGIRNQVVSDKKQLKLLNDPKLRAAFDANFNAQEATRKTDLELSGISVTNEQLQEQLNLYKQLEKSDPLSPLLLKVPALEYNLNLLKLQEERRRKLNELEKEWYATSGAMGKAEYDRRKIAIANIDTVKKQSLALDLKANEIAANSKMASDLLTKSQFIQESIKGVSDARSSLFKGYGLDFRAEKLDKQSAIDSQRMEFARATIQLNEFIEKNKLATGENKLTNEQINELRENLKKLNEYKLDGIKQQFSELGAVIKGVSSSFKSGFKEFLLSTKDVGKASADLFDSIARGLTDTLAEIASKRMTDALFGWTEKFLGGKKSKGGLNPGEESTMKDIPGSVPIEVPKIETARLETASMTLQQAGRMLMEAAISLNNQAVTSSAVNTSGSIFSGLGQGSGLGSDGSFVGDTLPNESVNMAFAGGMVGKLPIFAEGGIVGAMNKERSLTGRKPHLIVASEGERVLNHKQTAIWNKLQGSVANFASGGVVGASSNGNIASKMGNTTTINVPVSVAVGSDSEVDTGRLSQAVQAMVSDGIRREMRTGGSINRGNPYSR